MDCKNCYWYGRCIEHEPCEDFTALDDSYLREEYLINLKERYEEYCEFIKEMNS